MANNTPRWLYRFIPLLIFVITMITSVAFAQDTTGVPTVTPDAQPTVAPDNIAEMQALVDEARRHMEDAQRYAGDASNFLGLFEALGLTVTVGGALLAGLGVQRLFSAQNQLNEARKRFDEELKKREEDLARVNAQLLAEAESLRKEAVQQGQQIEKNAANASLATALLPLGERQYKAKDYKGAIETFKRALELDKQNPVTYLRLGYVATQMGQLDAARSYLENSLEIDPHLTPALAALGYVYRRIGEQMKKDDMTEQETIERERMLDEAEIMLRNALRETPKLVDDDGESWWGSLGGLYRRREYWQQAIKAYEKAREVTPQSSYPSSNLALLYAQVGDPSKMMETYKRVEVLAKNETLAEIDNHWAYSDLLTAQLALGKSREIEVVLQAVIDTTPVDAPKALPSLIDTLTRLTTALGGEEKAPHIKPVIDKLQAEIARREAIATTTQSPA